MHHEADDFNICVVNFTVRSIGYHEKGMFECRIIIILVLLWVSSPHNFLSIIL